MTSFMHDFAGQWWLLVAQTPPVPESFTAANGGGGEKDFRSFVWIAYGLTLLLLACFSLFLVFQNRALSRRLVQLSERFEHAQAKRERQAAQG